MKDVRDALMIGHSSDGKLIRRPLSPHLQVYRPQITSVLSIMNRTTGIISSVGALVMVWWLVALATGPGAFGRVQSVAGSWVGLLLLFGWTASLFYHFFGGLRHLAWDNGVGYSLEATHRSGWAALIATAVCTVLVWVAVFFVMRG